MQSCKAPLASVKARYHMMSGYCKDVSEFSVETIFQWKSTLSPSRSTLNDWTRKNIRRSRTEKKNGTSCSAARARWEKLSDFLGKNIRE